MKRLERLLALRGERLNSARRELAAQIAEGRALDDLLRRIDEMLASLDGKIGATHLRGAMRRRDLFALRAEETAWLAERVALRIERAQVAEAAEQQAARVAAASAALRKGEARHAEMVRRASVARQRSARRAENRSIERMTDDQKR